MNRRNALRLLTAGGGALAAARPIAAQPRSLPPLKITDVKTILTQPAGDHLVVVKVLTSEPGLYGIGCATHKERPLAVLIGQRPTVGGHRNLVASCRWPGPLRWLIR